MAASTDEWLATLVPDDLDKMLDLSSFGFGERSLAWVLSGAVVGHTQAHWGEICASRALYGGNVTRPGRPGRARPCLRAPIGNNGGGDGEPETLEGAEVEVEPPAR